MWSVSNPVEVRSNSAQAWVAGVVTAISSVCYKVTLDVPMTANNWAGITRTRAGNELVYTVDVLKHCDALVPNMHIRTPV